MSEPRRILVIYTGGTLGMVPSDKGYVPKAGYLEHKLRSMPQFHVPGEAQLTLPRSEGAHAARYDILEYDPLMDSSNMGNEDWVHIAQDIERHYQDYDAFVVIHGTDTMSYTASALSFMLFSLTKTVILTGSQIPISQVRNDAVDNLLGALIIAADYDIPEVCLFFRSKLWRGNRTRKVDAAGLDAFRAGNMDPLAKAGVRISVDWDQVRTPTEGFFQVRPITTRHVASIRLYPGMTEQTLERILQPPLQGAVLETYGAGNGPDARPEFLRVLRNATDKGIVLVNVTQCHRGTVAPDYAAGRALRDAGLVSGGDMTAEAALTKLAYLLSQDPSPDMVRTFMQVDLRGEITPLPVHARHSFRERRFLRSIAESLPDTTEQSLSLALYPVLLCAAAKQADLQALKRMVRDGAVLDQGDHDGRTALHLAAAEGHDQVVSWLLNHGANPKVTDRWGRTPLQEARAAGHDATVMMLEARAGG